MIIHSRLRENITNVLQKKWSLYWWFSEINQVTLSKIFGTSKVTIREVLEQIESVGSVGFYVYKIFIIKIIDKKYVINLYNVERYIWNIRNKRINNIKKKIEYELKNIKLFMIEAIIYKNKSDWFHWIFCFTGLL